MATPDPPTLALDGPYRVHGVARHGRAERTTRRRGRA